jgi:hypothetical protein
MIKSENTMATELSSKTILIFPKEITHNIDSASKKEIITERTTDF